MPFFCTFNFLSSNYSFLQIILFSHTFNVLSPQLYFQMTQFSSVSFRCMRSHSHHRIQIPSHCAFLSFIQCEMNNEEKQGIEQSTGYSLLNADTSIRYQKKNISPLSSEQCIHTYSHTSPIPTPSIQIGIIFFPVGRRGHTRERSGKNREKITTNKKVGTLFAFVCVSQFHIQSIRNEKCNHQHQHRMNFITFSHKRSRLELMERKNRVGGKSREIRTARTTPHNTMRITSVRMLDWWMYRFCSFGFPSTFRSMIYTDI